MKKEIAELWAQALESGEYEQGTDGLRNGDSFCCLGVLADLHRKATGGIWIAIENETFYSYLESILHLPLKVSEWAGISSSCVCPRIIIGQRHLYLSDLNDGADRKTFPEIAALIRKHWVEL